MDSVTNVALDTSEVRPARAAKAAKPARARPLVRIGGAAFGLVALAAAGYGAFVVLGPQAGVKLASVPSAAPRGKIQFGPLADMPDIRDGVPAIVRSAPANLVERRVVETAPIAVPAPQPPKRDVAAVLTRPAEPPLSASSAEPANAPAAASTAALRPSVAPTTRDAPSPVRDEPAPVRIVATQPVPSDPAAAPDPVVASLEPAPTPLLVEAPPVSARRDPDPVGVGQPAPVRPAASPAQPARAVANEMPPLPPVRRVSRTIEAPVQASPARQSSAAPRPVAAPANAPAPVTARAVPQPEERPEIFGVPLPGFVPTGRQIRDAASSVADAVTSLPDVF